jgi:hypothetical protein
MTIEWTQKKFSTAWVGRCIGPVQFLISPFHDQYILTIYSSGTALVEGSLEHCQEFAVNFLKGLNE